MGADVHDAMIRARRWGSHSRTAWGDRALRRKGHRQLRADADCSEVHTCKNDRQRQGRMNEDAVRWLPAAAGWSGEGRPHRILNRMTPRDDRLSRVTAREAVLDWVR